MVIMASFAQALSPPHQSTACGMITERTREGAGHLLSFVAENGSAAADSGISMFLREAEQEAERRVNELLHWRCL